LHRIKEAANVAAMKRTLNNCGKFVIKEDANIRHNEHVWEGQTFPNNFFFGLIFFKR
jgi:hypothetical protein